MKEVNLVSTINNGIKNPNIITVFDIEYDDFEVSFYGKEKLSHAVLSLSDVAGWSKVSRNSYVYNIRPKMMETVYAQVSVNGEVVSKIKIKNSILNSVKYKYFVSPFIGIKKRLNEQGKRKFASMFIPIKYRQKFYNKMLNSIMKKGDPNFSGLNMGNVYEYNYWVNNFEKFSEVKEYEYNPKISVVIPVYNCPIVYLRECIDSILNQTYKNFEVCLCDDASTDKDVVKVLKEYEELDSRIKVFYSKENGHISKATNNALSIASGEFIAFMDNDDTISPYAFNEVVKTLNENNSVDLIYSDEDKMDLDGTRMHPSFKPDFSPETLLGSNYICHLVVARRRLVEEIGGIREGYEGVQDHDFLLRLTEVTSSIAHIPKILYHWRMIPGSTALDVKSKSYITENGIKMVEDALACRGLKGQVSASTESSYTTILGNDNELITIVIPTRDGADILGPCLKSVYDKSSYRNFEVIVIDNGSEKEETFKLFKEYKNHSNFRVLRMDCPFNYSHLNNEAVKQANGEYILLLNNDVEVISENWLEALLGHARIEEIGAVGALLYYPNDTVQHCGVILGIGGAAAHCHLQLSAARVKEVASGRTPSNFSAVTAACLMVSKKKYMEVGMLNEKDLTVAFNDIDFCLRLLEKGYRNVVHPDAKLYHYESISRGSEDTDEKKNRFHKEINYLRTRHYDIVRNDPLYNVNLSKMEDYKLRVVDREVEEEVLGGKFKS